MQQSFMKSKKVWKNIYSQALNNRMFRNYTNLWRHQHIQVNSANNMTLKQKHHLSKCSRVSITQKENEFGHGSRIGHRHTSVSALYKHDRPFLELHFQPFQVANCFCDSHDLLKAQCDRSLEWIWWRFHFLLDCRVCRYSWNFHYDTAYNATAP